MKSIAFVFLLTFGLAHESLGPLLSLLGHYGKFEARVCIRSFWIPKVVVY
jgi:hypothetical protein